MSDVELNLFGGVSNMEEEAFPEWVESKWHAMPAVPVVALDSTAAVSTAALDSTTTTPIVVQASSPELDIGKLISETNKITDIKVRTKTYKDLVISTGSARIMNVLGNNYYGQKNYADAFTWYSKAAALQCPAAIDNLADCYSEGTGVPKDKKYAIELYHKAEGLGCVRAMHNLAIIYVINEKQYKKAFEYAEKAAALKYPATVELLGQMYLNPENLYTTYDKIKAYKLLEEAVKLGRPPTKELADIRSNGNFVLIAKLADEIDMLKAKVAALESSKSQEAPANNILNL